MFYNDSKGFYDLTNYADDTISKIYMYLAKDELFNRYGASKLILKNIFYKLFNLNIYE